MNTIHVSKHISKELLKSILITLFKDTINTHVTVSKVTINYITETGAYTHIIDYNVVDTTININFNEELEKICNIQQSNGFIH